MPQIWLTYAEIGGLFACDAAAARSKVLSLQLDRRRSHDGNTRVKLDAKLTDIFLDGLARQWIDRELAASAADLFALRERMSARADSPARPHRIAAG